MGGFSLSALVLREIASTKKPCHLRTALDYNSADRCKMKRGKSLKPIHDAMRKWGEKFQAKQNH